MAKTNKPFNVNAIDDLIGNFQNQVASLEKKKEEALDKVNSHKEAANLGATFAEQFNPVDMYTAIEDVMRMSIELLVAAKQMVSSMPDGESLSGFASLVSSINATFSEFSSMYRDQIKFTNAYNLEMLKFENKKKLEEHKYKLKQEAAMDLEEDPESGSNKVAFNTWDLVKTITAQQKEQANNE